ncbi:MAG: hypothetical protein HZB84_05820 [Deltaproteobacteria bacterium]|nr:hypothetical protein [Deltaproteobacteria bacterium]
MENKENKLTYLKGVEEQIREWDKKLVELDVRVRSAATDVKSGYEEQIRVLRAKKAELLQKVQGLKGSSDEAWKSMRDGVSKAAAELKTAFDQAVSKFK